MNLWLPDDPPVIRHVFEDEAAIRDEYWHPQAGEVVVDVGCHFGSYTFPALAAGATVYAVDPDPEVLNVLDRIRDGNPDLPGELVVVCRALAEQRGLSGLFRSFLAAIPGPTMTAPLDASFTSLDALTSDFMRLDWVKVDVEGLELAVLHGGEEALRRFSPAILIEDHTTVYQWVRDIRSTEQCTEFLEGLGYAVQAGIPSQLTGPYSDRTYILARKHG